MQKTQVKNTSQVNRFNFKKPKSVTSTNNNTVNSSNSNNNVFNNYSNMDNNYRDGKKKGDEVNN